MDGPLTAEQEKQIRFIESSAFDLTEMVNDLLDLAKIEAGRISISPEWFEMLDLFAALRGIFKPLLTNASVALILEEPRDLPRIYTDHKKLSQILRNFISNALKFTPKGEVRVSAERCRTNGSSSPLRIQASVLPKNSRPRSSKTLFKSIRPCRKSGAGRDWDCR